MENNFVNISYLNLFLLFVSIVVLAIIVSIFILKSVKKSTKDLAEQMTEKEKALKEALNILASSIQNSTKLLIKSQDKFDGYMKRQENSINPPTSSSPKLSSPNQQPSQQQDKEKQNEKTPTPGAVAALKTNDPEDACSDVNSGVLYKKGLCEYKKITNKTWPLTVNTKTICMPLDDLSPTLKVGFNFTVNVEAKDLTITFLNNKYNPIITIKITDKKVKINDVEFEDDIYNANVKKILFEVVDIDQQGRFSLTINDKHVQNLAKWEQNVSFMDITLGDNENGQIKQIERKNN